MSCVRRVRSILSEQPHVQTVGVDFGSQVAYIVPAGDFDVEAALAALEAGGYPAEVRP